jgi:hypothetical protein
MYDTLVGKQVQFRRFRFCGIAADITAYALLLVNSVQGDLLTEIFQPSQDQNKNYMEGDACDTTMSGLSLSVNHKVRSDEELFQVYNVNLTVEDGSVEELRIKGGSRLFPTVIWCTDEIIAPCRAGPPPRTSKTLSRSKTC